VIALLLVLTLASSAWAECAWVLWSSSVLPFASDQRWSVVGAYSPALGGESACLRRADVWNKAAETDQSKKLLSMVYTCLPDTIDPRGPKGGGR